MAARPDSIRPDDEARPILHGQSAARRGRGKRPRSPARERHRTNDANFEACVASVQKVEAERKRSAPDLFYTPHDLARGHDRDKYLCAMGNSSACKLPGGR